MGFKIKLITSSPPSMGCSWEPDGWWGPKWGRRPAKSPEVLFFFWSQTRDERSKIPLTWVIMLIVEKKGVAFAVAVHIGRYRLHRRRQQCFLPFQVKDSPTFALHPDLTSQRCICIIWSYDWNLLWSKLLQTRGSITGQWTWPLGNQSSVVGDLSTCTLLLSAPQRGASVTFGALSYCTNSVTWRHVDWTYQNGQKEEVINRTAIMIPSRLIFTRFKLRGITVISDKSYVLIGRKTSDRNTKEDKISNRITRKPLMLGTKRKTCPRRLRSGLIGSVAFSLIRAQSRLKSKKETVN